MAKKLLFLVYEINSLEYRITDSVLRKHNYELTAFRYQLEHYSDAELHTYLTNAVNEGVVCTLPGLPLDRCEGQPYLEHITQLAPNKIPGGMSVLGQVCAIIGHQSSRYENLVSSFALRHIKGLREAGATTEEIKQITLRDRLARGNSLRDECIMAEYLNQLQFPAPRNHGLVHEAGIYHEEESALDRPECRMAFLDYLLSRADLYGVFTVLINHFDEHYRVKRSDVYTNSLPEISALRRVAEKTRYIMSTYTRDARTGLYTCHLSMTINSRQVFSFRERLERQRRPKW